MLVILSPDTVANPAALRLRRLGEPMLGRGFRLIPRGTRGALRRVVLDQPFVRYMLALSPFPAMMLIWPDLALPIAQAPLLMFGLVYAVESRVLAIPDPARRKTLVPPEETARVTDLLGLRSRQILSRIAAGRGMRSERLHLVVEQSRLARVAPLTLVSVQIGEPRAEILPLRAEERAIIAAMLFDDTLDEARLHLVNLAENRFLRSHTIEARSLSAHARLMGHAAARAASAGAPASQDG